MKHRTSRLEATRYSSRLSRNVGYQKMKSKLSFALLALLQFAVHPAIGQEAPRLTQVTPREILASLLPQTTYELGAVIPGLQQGAIPQGLAYSKQHNAILISHYFDRKRASCVSLIDSRSGKLVHARALKEANDTFHFGHVGGIAVSSTYIWISSSGHVYQYSLADLLDTKRVALLVPLSQHKVETRASFCTYHNGILFVGEFAYGNRYQTHESHHLTDRKGVKKYAWICGYEVNKRFTIPTSVLSIRQRVQGIHITDEWVFLSISYGRRNRSTIAVYRNPLSDPPHKRVKLRDGTIVPLWFLDGANWLKSIDFPPMSEGLTDIDGKLAVLSESGATKYQKGGKGPIDNIVLLDMKELMR